MWELGRRIRSGVVEMWIAALDEVDCEIVVDVSTACGILLVRRLALI